MGQNKSEFNEGRRNFLKLSSAGLVAVTDFALGDPMGLFKPSETHAAKANTEGPRFGEVCMPLDETKPLDTSDLLTVLEEGKMEVIANTDLGLKTGWTLVVDSVNQRIVRYKNGEAMDSLSLKNFPDNYVICSGAGGELGSVPGQKEKVFIANPNEFDEIVVGTIDLGNGGLEKQAVGVPINPFGVVGLDGRYRKPSSRITGVGYHMFRGPWGEKFNVDSIAGQDNFAIPRFAKIMGTGNEKNKKAESLPAEIVLPIEAVKQIYSLNCEEALMDALLRSWGKLPPSKLNTWQTADPSKALLPSDPNPDYGFRGDRNSQTLLGFQDYGAHARPVSEKLNQMKIPSEAKYGLALDDLEMAVRGGNSVIVWVSPFISEPSVHAEPDAKRPGQTIRLVAGEHVWMVTGIRHVGSERQFMVIDPLGGYKLWVSRFPHWEKFGYMGVVAKAPGNG